MKQNIEWKLLEKKAIRKKCTLGSRLECSKTGCKTWHFAIWSPSATSVEIRFFSDGVTEHCSKKFFLSQQNENGEFTGLWQLELNAEELNEAFYEYYIETARGLNKCLDPYALSMAATTEKNSCGRAALIDLSCDKANPFGDWPKLDTKHGCKTLPPFCDNSKAIIYECSVRDMTISKNSPEQNASKKGTFLGFVQALPYLRELGVTHIQLMPVMKFYNTIETNRCYEDSNKTHGNNYNWGYDPQNYFTPEGWFSEDATDPYLRIAELKTLIKEAHALGLRVILDCVYNHMAKTQFLDDIAPGYYFRMTDDNHFMSNSGCGNDVATEHIMARKLIVDSLVYWLSEYHVDGFRFDLMGLIDSKTVMDAWKKCNKIKGDVLFIGEGWKMYNGRRGTRGCDQNFVWKSPMLAVFNDEYRDLAKAGGMNECGKAFLTGGKVSIQDLFCNVCGMPANYYSVKKPSCNVQYFDCHDGLTLHDCIVNNTPIDETSDEAHDFVAARLKLANALLLTSQGIVFLHSGQECGRTKCAFCNTEETVGRFVRNSYNSSDSINEFNWYLSPQNLGLLDYTKKLIQLRKRNGVFTIPTQDEIVSRFIFMGDFCSDFFLVYKILDFGGDWILCFNSGFEDQKIDLFFPEKFRVFADENDVYPDGKPFGKNEVIVKASSALILRTQ